MCTLHKADCKKTQKYVASLAPARLHPSVLLGTRTIVYRTCAFTSLGDLSTGSVKDVNCAVRSFKLRAVKDILAQPRNDGTSADQLTAKFRKLYRTRLQLAIARGNASLALAVGI